MSLDFDTTRIEDRKVHFPPAEDGTMNSALHVLIWISIPVGINHITEANVEEFWRRTDIRQRVIGSGFNVVEGNEVRPYVLTKENVVNAVGLMTNVSRKTRPQFLEDLYTVHERTHRFD